MGLLNGLSLLWWEGWHLPSTCLLPLLPGNLFSPFFYYPSSCLSDTFPVAGGELKGGCDRLTVPAEG